MTRRVLVMVDLALPPRVLADCKSLTAQLADCLGEPVTLALQPVPQLERTTDLLQTVGGCSVVDLEPGFDPGAATMTSAEFVWRNDGRPDWASMWTGFCELALYGGAPHRGEDASLQAHVDAVTVATESDPVVEIQRGILETTGLLSEPADAGWLAVTCESSKMAAWLCAAIIMENIEARCDNLQLLVPASPDFRLKDEVKSVITVVAKTNHYWMAHMTAVRRNTPAARAVRDLVSGWWDQRRMLRPDNAWELPFPARVGETARVLWQRADRETGETEMWRAGLVRERARTAYIEVHSPAGPIPALESLYQHVV